METVGGGVKALLRLEGLAVLAVSALAFREVSADWALFAVLFLMPDLFMLGYLRGPRIGAAAYNFSHSYLGPLVLGALGLYSVPILIPFALIWTAHIGFDRALGYGLKYSEGFGVTHLGRIGKAAKLAEAAA